MINISFPVAFFAGIVSFFAPCVIPLLPAYVGYVTGVSLKDLKEKGYKPYKKQLIITSLLYILGFALVFVLLGTAAAGFGQFFRNYSLIIQRLGGLIILILGFEFSGVIQIPILYKQKKITLPKWTERLGYAKAFFVGLIFASVWTPCIGAVLGSILTLAAVSQTAFYGALLLFVYSLGIAAPFLIVSMTLATAPKYLAFISARIEIITKVSGSTLIVLGILLITDTYKYLNSWLFELAFKFGYQIK